MVKTAFINLTEKFALLKSLLLLWISHLFFIHQLLFTNTKFQTVKKFRRWYFWLTKFFSLKRKIPQPKFWLRKRFKKIFGHENFLWTRRFIKVKEILNEHEFQKLFNWHENSIKLKLFMNMKISKKNINALVYNID